NILSETAPSSGDRFKFTSREWDSEIGLYDDRGRYLAPNIGRFPSEDPIGFSGGDLDLYRYVDNSPTDRTDPLGLWPDCLTFNRDNLPGWLNSTSDFVYRCAEIVVEPIMLGGEVGGTYAAMGISKVTDQEVNEVHVRLSG